MEETASYAVRTAPSVRKSIKGYRIKKAEETRQAQDSVGKEDPDRPVWSRSAAEKKSNNTPQPQDCFVSSVRPNEKANSNHEEPSIPKQKPPLQPKTRQVIEEQSGQKNLRPVKNSVAGKKMAPQKSVELGRQYFKRHVHVQSVRQSQVAVNTTQSILRKTGAAVVRAVRSMAAGLVGLVGSMGLAVIFCVALFIGTVAASPFGIFFANEPSAHSISLSTAVAQINMELNTRLSDLQEGDYTSITIQGAPPDWAEVIAVFASHIAGAEDGTDVAMLDSKRVELLRETFWDMCGLSRTVERIEAPTTEESQETEAPEVNLHIYISARTAEEMREIYNFTDFQNEALDLLLAESDAITAMVGNLAVSQEDAVEVLSNLPADLSPERLAVVRQALTLVGKVNYFWGGKSLVLGWDSRWGQLTKVTAPGSRTTGTFRPYGLDCSGFVDWVFYNFSGGEYIIGHGGGAGAQHRYCTDISWTEAQPGDLAFYPNDDHIGIVCGWGENGDILIVHCASGYDNVVITGKSGFICVAQPLYLGE